MRALLLIAFLLLLPGNIPACKVPVFRYALERWPADNFRLLALNPGPLDETLGAEFLDLQKSLESEPPSVNVDLEVIDLLKLSEAQRVSVPGLDAAGNEAALILLPPPSWRSQKPAWTGDLNSENLALLLDSPARKRCQEHLLQGESAVFFILQSGEAGKDAAARALVEEGLQKAMELLEVPEGVIRREDLNKGLENIDLDDVLRSDLPLKISFVVETIAPDDAKEAIFRAILLGPNPPRADGPLIVPVFGRGRTPGPVPAAAVTADRIFAACQYLSASCSCQVKQGNPGYDLLFLARWDEHLNTSILSLDSEVVTNALDTVTFGPNGKDSDAEPPEPPGPAISLLLIATIGIAAILLACVAVVFLRKPSPTS